MPQTSKVDQNKDRAVRKQSARDKLLNSILTQNQVRRKVRKELGSKQLLEEGSFSKSMMSDNKLLKPPYEPAKLFRIVEGSGILPQCIEAMVHNIDGFGYQLMYVGPDGQENDAAALQEKLALDMWFSKVNEKESFTTVRKQMRRDLETCGNGYFELIRYNDGDIAMVYRVDAKYVRLQALQKNPVEIKVLLPRNGKMSSATIKKRFRKFAMVTKTAATKIKWFKEYGDARVMCAVSGKYQDELTGDEQIIEEANEIVHFKLGNETYGIPRWIGSVLSVMGLQSADYVNWDLFDNQVVPPLAIMVSGGTLSSESVEDIRNVLIDKKGVENFNKVLIIEGDSDGQVSDKSSVKIEMKEMSTARKEDSMFTNYTDKGEHRVRGNFRLPPLYLGRADTYSKSTADSSKMVAEEQVFVPERALFDEYINVMMGQELEMQLWKYHSKGPRLVTGTEMIDGFNRFAKYGIFSINDGVRLANNVLGQDITKYEQAWANYPVAIVLELAKIGLLTDIDEITTVAGDLGSLLNSADASNPDDAAKIYVALSQLRGFLSDMAGKRERKLMEWEEQNLAAEDSHREEAA